MTEKTVISPIRTVIVSHMDLCKNKFTYHLSDKTHGFGSDGDLFTVEERVLEFCDPTNPERAAHVASHMIVCCK